MQTRGFTFIGKRKNNMAKKRKRKKGRKKIILFVFEILLLLVVLGVLAIYNSTIGKIDFKEELTNSEAGVNEDIKDETVQTMHGYLNVALFGLDNRSTGKYNTGNSDTIIIASLNYDTNEVQLVSIYRDTYLSIGKGKYAKANAAFANGGVEQAVQMVNSNLDLDITKYVCVDWKALIEVIDKLGGLDLEVTSQEAREINNFIDETAESTGNKAKHLKGGGNLHLDGVQAVTYARIRSTAGDDFLRASRQRIVLQAMLEKAKNADIATLTSMCSAMMDDISTNFTVPEMASLAKNVMSYNIKSTTGFPYELTTMTLSSTGSTVIPIDLETNVSELHKYLFNDESYSTSDTVQLISSNISKKTGVTEKTATIDLTDYNETVGTDGTEGTKQQNKNKKQQSTENSDNLENSNQDKNSKLQK